MNRIAMAEGIAVLVCLGSALLVLFVWLPWIASTIVRRKAERDTHKRLLRERGGIPE